MKQRLLALVFPLAFSAGLNAQVVINEIMQSNIDCIMDDINEFPDSWVELYNSGSKAENLENYSIGVTSDANAAWKLPKSRLSPCSYKLVYCDKEAKELHTDFRLESGKGCKLYLFKDGVLVDQLPADMKKQPAPNIAFGRETDGADVWGYQLVPTPQQKNCGQVCSNKQILGDPVFSVEGKVFKAGTYIRLKLSLPEGAPEGTEIRFTEDGSEPTEQSQLYSEILRFQDTKIIRAKLFCKGYLSPRSRTHSYIKFDRDLTLPVVSICTDKKYFFDDKTGIYVDGSYSSKQRNYEFNWRRPINFEYFGEELKPSELNQLCEARVTGGASRGAMLKSLGVYANKRFGEKRLSYEFFPDQRPGVKDFKSIMLRNAGNDFDYLYMRDAVIQRLMSSYLDLDWQAWSPVIFYLNGEYKGMLNIRERSNEDNIYTNYNGLEDIDMVENWFELKEGSMDNWTAFQTFYNEHGHTWQEFEEYLDVEEFLNVMIMNLFFCNLDFPGNNCIFWRPRAKGGRWRMVVKDTDFGLGLYDRSSDYRILEWLHNPNYDSNNAWGANSYEATRLFRRLMEDKTFYREFIDRFAIYMGDFMNYGSAWKVWEPMYEKIKQEYPHHRKLINQWWPNYEKELNSAKQWLKDRVGLMYNQLNAYYHVGSPCQLMINKGQKQEELDKMQLTFNGVSLSNSTFDGMFFAGREVTLHSDDVARWEVMEVYDNGPVNKTVEGSTYTFTMPSCRVAMITAVTNSAAGIDDVCVDDAEQAKGIYDAVGVSAIYNAAGIKRQKLSPGLNIVRTKRGTVKVLRR